MALKQVFNGASLSTSSPGNQVIFTLKNNVRNSVHLVTFMAAGQMAGAQVKLQLGASASAGTVWVDLASTTISTSGVVNVELAEGYLIRPHLYSVSAGVTSVDAWIGIGTYVR